MSFDAYRLSVSAALLFVGVSAADAHHSIAGVYDGQRQVTMTAVVRDFQFVNPHPKIVVEVVELSGDVPAAQGGAAAGGEPDAWTLEMDNRWELAELGFTDDTLVPGDRIVVTGSMARKKPRALYVRSLDHSADGFTYRHHR